MSIRAANARNEASSSVSLLDAALSLARTQPVGQLADETSVDGRMMGTLGFSGALLAACLAARSLLGAFWWMPLLVLGGSLGVVQLSHQARQTHTASRSTTTRGLMWVAAWAGFVDIKPPVSRSTARC